MTEKTTFKYSVPEGKHKRFVIKHGLNSNYPHISFYGGDDGFLLPAAGFSINAVSEDVVEITLGEELDEIQTIIVLAL